MANLKATLNLVCPPQSPRFCPHCLILSHPVWSLEDSPEEALLPHPLTQERPTQLSKVGMAPFTAEEAQARSRGRHPQVHQAEPWVSDSPRGSWAQLTPYSAHEHREVTQGLVRAAGSLPSRDP